MPADELFQQGKLSEAIEAQRQEVRGHPADHGRRVFLFELLVFAGDLDRARKQIDVVQYDDPEVESATVRYRKLLDAEQARRRLFAEGVRPTLFGDPPDHVRLRLEAVDRLREGHVGEAAAALAQAAEATPAFRGTLNGEPFDELRDCDDLLGSVLEVMWQGQYMWVALETIEALVASPPRFPRDLIWLPGHLDVRDGPGGEVFLPSLYPQSHEHPDDQVKLGRANDWLQSEDGPVLGRGRKSWLVDDQTLDLLAVRELLVENPHAGSGPADTGQTGTPP